MRGPHNGTQLHYSRVMALDTLATFSVGVEKLGDVKCLHSQVKLMLLEMLDEQLEEAIKALEELVKSEDAALAAGTFAQRDYGSEAFTWSEVTNNIVKLAQEVFDTPSCEGGQLPADMVKVWMERFDLPPGGGSGPSAEILTQGWEREPVWI